ncbi:hybrid sensor histidine kinase/response regulator [Pseudorhodoferax sp.]|uniref:hybrid sensor histidine kinase/response regulator n=1 Tax=Pseudorhodoferax sp. TaxID=1993553 RepID=UPI002DD6B2B0|nr:ATP-binding protein [Pseudorhodoferax sp.]
MTTAMGTPVLVALVIAGVVILALSVAQWFSRRALRQATAALHAAQRQLADEASTRLGAEQRLHAHNRDMRAMIDGFPGFLAVTDAQLTYTYANDYGLRWIGKARQDVIGHSIRENLSETRVAEIIEFMTTARTGEPMTVESYYPEIPRRAAAWLQVTQVMGQPDADGKRSCFVFAIDITRRKSAEAAALAAKDAAEQASRAKSAFLANMSHELRTPLNAIMGFGQLLAADHGRDLRDQHRAHAGEIVRASRHLLGLINEVLDLAMIERGRLQVSLEAVHAGDMIQECVSLLQPLAHKDGISLASDGAPPAAHVLADRTRLRQVILNLGANAIKYNRSAGTVRLIGREADGQIRIDVIDSGPGMSEEQQARLFQSFERLDAGRTAIEGAGLGLALSRAFMLAMGGHIGVSSTPGRGSTFSITLPATPAPASYVEPLAAPLPDTAPVVDEKPLPEKVLYIEDNRINTVIMEVMVARICEEAGPVQLLTAPTALIGLEMAAEERPDLILLDLHLPEMTGFEVLERLRQQEALRTTPVIAFSANSMPAYIERAMAAGFDHYLSKPVDMGELKRTLQRFGTRAVPH